MKVYEGKLVTGDIRIGIVCARFNDFIVSKLLDGALDALSRHDIRRDNVDIAKCPGAFEIPLVAKRMARTGRYDGIICLGAVIRGNTPHFDYVCAEAAKGVAQVMLGDDIPVAFGILTTDNIEQAVERAGTKAGNKGYDSAMSAIEMINLLKDIG